MNALALQIDALQPEDRRTWGTAAVVALMAHILAVGLAVAWVRQAEPPRPEPVVLIDLPPLGKAAASAPSAAQSIAAPTPTAAQMQTATPPIDVPPVRAPLPSDPVLLSPPAPLRPAMRTADPAPAPATIPAATSTPVARPAAVGVTAPVGGNDLRARQQELDYFALVRP